MKVKIESEVAQSCPTLRDPMDCSLSGSSVHEIFQARVLEWVAIAFSKITAASAKLVEVLSNLALSSVQFRYSVVSDSLQPHELQHAGPPCPSPTSTVHSDSHPSSQWCHPAISSSKKGNAKGWANYRTIALISHVSKVMLKILQARLQQYVNCELPDVHAGFTKGRGTRDQIANIRWIIEKARQFQKNIYFCLLTMPKPLTVWIITNCGKFFKRWEYQTTWPASWEICMQVRKQQLELDMEQQTGSK